MRSTRTSTSPTTSSSASPAEPRGGRAAARGLGSRSPAVGRKRSETAPEDPRNGASVPQPGEASADARRIRDRMIVLGIDPGLANTGYGVVRLSGGRLAALDGGVVATPAGMPAELRLAAIHRAIGELLDRHQPGAVALEQLYFGQNVRTAFAVGQARGVVMAAAGAQGIVCHSYTPQQVKGGRLRERPGGEGPGRPDGRGDPRTARAATRGSRGRRPGGGDLPRQPGSARSRDGRRMIARPTDRLGGEAP
jgi:crossover junction endodeoxyribonuclease RuvC